MAILTIQDKTFSKIALGKLRSMPLKHCPSTNIGSVQPDDFVDYLKGNRQCEFTEDDAKEVERFQEERKIESWHQEMVREKRDLYQRWLYSRWLEDAKTFLIACHRNSNNPRYEVLVERGETFQRCPESPGGGIARAELELSPTDVRSTRSPNAATTEKPSRIARTF